MVLPLIAVAAALLAKNQQDRAQAREKMNDVDRSEAATLANIRARRAARAGDSGYMQAAAGGISNLPTPDYNLRSSKMMGEVGQALLSQRSAPETASNTTAPQLRENDSYYTPSYGKGAIANNDDYAGSDAESLDDEFSSFA